MSRLLIVAGLLLATSLPAQAADAKTAAKPAARPAAPAPRPSPAVTSAPEGLKVDGVSLTLGAMQEDVRKALGDDHVLKGIEGTPSLWVFRKGQESGTALASLEFRGGQLTAITRERAADATQVAAIIQELVEEGRTSCTLETEAPPGFRISRLRCGRRELAIVRLSQDSGEKTIVTEMVR